MPLLEAVRGSGGLTVIMCMSFDHRAPVDGLRAFKDAILVCPCVKAAMEVSGTFDLILQIEVEDITVYARHLERLSPELSCYVERYEANFLCRMVREPGASEPRFPPSLWVHGKQGFTRIDVSRIDRVTAERDYVRLHCGRESWLLHSTVHGLLEKLDPDLFVRIHRSTIVRRDFIERIIHSGRSWSTRLRDGTLEPVSRSHVDGVMDMLADHSSNAEARPSSDDADVEKSTLLGETHGRR